MRRFHLKNLKKYFERGGYFSKKDKQLVLNIDELIIDEKDSVGLIGESGSGKTTLAKLLMRILKPDTGTVEYYGKDIFSLSGEELRIYRQQCQMIFQDPSSQFNPRMKIRDLLAEPLLINGIRKDIDERVNHSLSLVSLSKDIKDRYIHQISGGQRQRISIARALILNPSFIICDEPVSALDISVQTQILNLLYILKDQLNVRYLMISHDLSVVKFLCDYVYILFNGRIVEKGRTEEIFSTPYHPYTRELIEASKLNIEESTLKTEYNSQNDIHTKYKCPFTRCSQITQCKQQEIVERKITETHSVFCNL